MVYIPVFACEFNGLLFLINMKNTTLLARRFREVMLDGTWVANTNYKDQLDGSGWEMVTRKFASLNTIADLAQHIHYYINGVNNALKNGKLEISDKYSFDFPVIQSQNDWEAFLAKLWKDTEEFASLIEQLSDQTLEASFIDEKYGTYQRNIDGMMEHCYYHLGQIVLIKKLLKQD